jgi:hypothetical protein
MGFKTSNYESKAYGITIPEAYARITKINVDVDGKADARFEIQQSRDTVGTKVSLALVPFRCEIDKDLPLHKQIYEKAKEEVFKGWEDDIV